MYPKAQRIRLKSKALKQLNNAIFIRDGHGCVICGRFVVDGTKFHHEPCGANKSDEISKGVVLCNDCHYERHHGKRLIEYRAKIVEYLRRIYG